MAALFVGNSRSSGRYDPARDRAFTEYTGLTVTEFAAHLKGAMGCGAVPILDDNTCNWAAIDIDNHDSDEDIPIKDIDEKIRKHHLPLIACRSKSGGVHAYLFLDEPQPATRIRSFMNSWATLLGHGGSEVFPKQGTLSNGRDGKKTLGNWINFPYFGGDTGNRYAVRDGKKLTLEEFLTLAERSRANDGDLRAFAANDHPDAPPCIQHLYSHGVAQGHRNEGLYNVVVYLKKADPENYDQKAMDANSAIFTKPLARAEASRTIASAGRSEYGYRCNEEPIRSLCDRESCLKRKFGITPADADRLQSLGAIPPFTDLVKYMSEPVRWELRIDGIEVTNISTVDLLDWRRMREIVADRLTRIVPMIKNNEWERILQPLMKDARIIEAPDDASVAGIIRDRLREYASKTDLTNKGENPEDRKALLRGLPTVQMVKEVGDRCVVFRAQDFVSYLKRTKSEELKGIALWFAVRGIGLVHWRCRVPGTDKNINVWALPVKSVLEHQAPYEKQAFKSEL